MAGLSMFQESLAKWDLVAIMLRPIFTTNVKSLAKNYEKVALNLACKPKNTIGL